MSFLVLGSVLAFGGLLAAFGVFDTDNDTDDSPPDPEETPHGGAGDDILSASEGAIEGWGGDDDITVSNDATGFGNKGDDTLRLNDAATGYGGDGNDRLAVRDDVAGPSAAFGDGGNDTLTSGITANDSLYGGAGNDALIGGNTYGGDGADTVGGLINLHGDGGDDVLSGYSSLFGGAGNDLIGAENYGGETDATGSAYGGAGNDTILADSNGGRSGDLAGGDGDDLISYQAGGDVFGGSGDDILIARSEFFNDAAASGAISLGEGADLLAMEAPLNRLPIAVPIAGYTPEIVSDFDSAQDQLAIIIPPGQQSAMDVTITANPAGGWTDIVIAALADPDFGGGPGAVAVQSFRLEGVTDLDAADILLFADAAAVAAGTSYSTLGA